jgi:hypothetical protein
MSWGRVRVAVIAGYDTGELRRGECRRSGHEKCADIHPARIVDERRNAL